MGRLVALKDKAVQSVGRIQNRQSLTVEPARLLLRLSMSCGMRQKKGK